MRIDLNRYRHRAVLPLYGICAAINTAVVALAVVGLTLTGMRFIAYYIALAFLFVNLFLSLGGMLSEARVGAVQVTPLQFGELYDVAASFAQRLGLRRVPAIYIRQDRGILNAFASFFFWRNYVVINAEVFEVAYLEHHDLEAVSFILAHEMAHIAFGHTRFWYNSSILIAKYIPFLYAALSRAQEYSCDQVAYKLCPQGRHGIFILLLGRHLYGHVNVDAYLQQAARTRGWFEFYANAKAHHPVPVRRVAALYGGKSNILF